MPVTGNKIAEPGKEHRSYLPDGALGIAADRILWIADERFLARRQDLANRRRRHGGHAIAIEEQDAGTHVEAVRERKTIHNGLEGMQTQGAVVGDPIAGQHASVMEAAEANAHVEGPGDADPGVGSQAEGGSAESKTKP